MKFDWVTVPAWHSFATPQASIIAGVAMLLLLMVTGRHRDKNGRTQSPNIVAAFLFGISVFTLVILIVCHFFLDNMMGIIERGFGEPRIAWLFVGLAIDGFARLYRLFDPPSSGPATVAAPPSGSSSAPSSTARDEVRQNPSEMVGSSGAV